MRAAATPRVERLAVASLSVAVLALFASAVLPWALGTTAPFGGPGAPAEVYPWGARFRGIGSFLLGSFNPQHVGSWYDRDAPAAFGHALPSLVLLQLVPVLLVIGLLFLFSGIASWRGPVTARGRALPAALAASAIFLALAFFLLGVRGAATRTDGVQVGLGIGLPILACLAALLVMVLAIRAPSRQVP